MDNHRNIIQSCGISVDFDSYLGGGSYSGMLWNVGDDEDKVTMLLLKTGGKIT